MTSERVFVFDLDGTLMDTRARQVSTLIDACNALGEPAPDSAQFWRYKRGGDSTRQALERVGVDPKRAHELADWWVAHIEDADRLRLDRILPGALEAAFECRRNALSVRVLTARSRPRQAIAQLRSSPLGNVVDEVEVVSPQHAIARKSKRLAQWRAIAMVGDTESDARAAALANVRFLAVECGQRSADYLRARCLDVFQDARTAVQAWAKMGMPNE